MAKLIGTEISEDRLADLDKTTIRRMVMAGAEACVEVTKREIDTYHHVSTGSMRENVRPNEYREDIGGGKIDVYPQDEDGRGVRNAMKAFIIDRGLGMRPNTKRSRGRVGNKTGDNFLTKKTRQEAEQAINDAMEAEIDRIIAAANK